MHRVLFMLFDAGIAGLFLLPLFLYLNKRYIHNWKRSGLYLLMAVYLSGMYAVVGLPDICYIQFELNFNIIPFAYMFSDFRNSLLNVLLFVPLGFFLPVLWTTFRSLPRTLLFGLSTSALIELLQIFTFRATDVNDLMTNTVGTLLGWCIARIALLLFPGIHPSERTREAYLVCGITFGIMFFLQPFAANVIFNLFLA